MQWTIDRFDDTESYLNVVFRRGDVWIEFLGLLRFDRRCAYYTEVHIQGPGAHLLGAASLRELVNVVKEIIDVDTIYVEGEIRTTGANPGRRPRPLIF